MLNQYENELKMDEVLNINPITQAQEQPNATQTIITPRIISKNFIGDPNGATTISDYWRIISSSTLTVASNSFSISGIPDDADLELQIKFQILAPSAAINIFVTFNGDTGANYAYTNERAFGGAISNPTSQSNFNLNNAAISNDFFGDIIIQDKLSVMKFVNFSGYNSQGTTAASSGEEFALLGKWVNTTSRISSITFSTGTADTFGAGSIINIYGRTPLI